MTFLGLAMAFEKRTFINVRIAYVAESPKNFYARHFYLFIYFIKYT